MHVKYFQSVADIKNYYREILEIHDDIRGIYQNQQMQDVVVRVRAGEFKDKEELIEEYEAIRYLVSCRLMFAHDENAYKPSVEVMNRCLNRYLDYLNRLFNCNQDTFRGYEDKIIQKRYKACRHYLFQFSLPAWYEKLPPVVLSIANKYPDKNR